MLIQFNLTDIFCTHSTESNTVLRAGGKERKNPGEKINQEKG